jgi:hypothetical protein
MKTSRTLVMLTMLGGAFGCSAGDAGSGTNEGDAVASGSDALTGTQIFVTSGVGFSTKSPGSAIGSVYALWSNGSVSSSVTFPVAGTYTFFMSLYGSPAAGVWPRAELRIDGVAVAAVTVDSATAKVFYPLAKVSAGAHAVSIAFTNDSYDGATGQDRNLFIQFLKITGPSTTTSPPPPVTDAGAPPPPPPVGTDAGSSAGGLDFVPGRKCTAATIAGATHVNAGANLQNAVNALPNGGTLVVGAGSYQGPIFVNGKQNVVICGAPGTRPVVSTSADLNIFDIASSSHVHIEGFELAGINDPSHSNQCGVKAGAATHHIAVWDTWIHDTPAAGIGASNDSGGHIDIRYNRVWNTAAYNGYHTSAVSFYELDNYGGANDANGYSDYIVGNMIFANAEKIANPTDGNCIIIDDNLNTQQGNRSGGPYTGRVLVANNLCVNNGGRGIHFFSSDHGDAVNNTVYHDVRTAFDGSQGEMDAVGGHDINFLNNLSVAASPGNVFDSYALGSTVALSHNFFNGPVARNPISGFTSGGNPMLTNPTLDPRSGDFRPRAGSPLIGAGTASLNGAKAPHVDFFGKARSSTTPSIGAFEP